MSNYFTELAKINVSEHVEKKGKFNYLSWTFAVNELRKRHPDATWEVKRFDDKPFMKTELGYFVEVAVTVNDLTLSQIHPVLDNRNRPIDQPTSFDVNTSIQRCLVKAIALHGLGLYIYAGEDLPTEREPITSEQLGAIQTKAIEFANLRNGSELDTYKALGLNGLNGVKNLDLTNADKAIHTIDNWIKKAKKESGSDDDTKNQS